MAQAWFPCHAHDSWSLLDGLSKPEQFAKRIAECGHAGSAITNHGNVASVVEFAKAMKKVDKKPVFGNEFYLCEKDPTIKDATNRKLSHLCVLARDAESWKNLIKATSTSNLPEHFYYKPRLNLEKLAELARGCITFSGHPGSDLANVLFPDIKAAYGARTKEEVLSLLKPDWMEAASALAGRYQDLWGKDNFFVEIQLIDAVNMPAAGVIGEKLREVAKRLSIPCLATADSHYPRQEDARDQRILLCAALNTTLVEVQRQLDSDEDIGLGGFFRSNRYHIPSLEEMVPLHTEEELKNSMLIAEMCESYDLLHPPRIPKFECPENKEANEYLRELCRQGWRKKIQGVVPKQEEARYADRVKMEMGVLFEAGLSPYFLIVSDYCRYAREVLKCKVGRGRGSGAGSLVGYLMDITGVDPIKYNLIFERFYNAGRNSPGRVALPDYDVDFPRNRRDEILSYLRTKYGDKHVAQMVTFSRMQGRGALRDVFRAHGTVSYEEASEITKHVPDEAAIADELQQMREENDEASIILWALEHNRKELSPYVTMEEDGSLSGEYAPYFAQAMRIEGTKRSQSKHASGIIISPDNLHEVCPMVYDKNSKQLICGWEMGALEQAGHVKFDVLGLGTLDRIDAASNFIRTGTCV